MSKVKSIKSVLFDPEKVSHAFFTRQGGVSPAPFDSLNFDPRDSDTRENIRQNRLRAGGSAGASLEALFLVDQVHGDYVYVLNGPAPGRVEADAIVTGLKGAPVGVLTADCLPAIFYDPVKEAAGVAHAGWKGTAKGVVIKTIEAMRREFSTDPNDLVASLGPAIGPCCYNIGQNVVDEFEKGFGCGLPYIGKRDGAYTLDLASANRAQLIKAGVREKNIEVCSPCTACGPGFFSYRRDNGRTGRQLSFIMLSVR